jgi:hypothetical protein
MEFRKEFVEVAAGELPLKRSRRRFVMLLEAEETILELGEGTLVKLQHPAGLLLEVRGARKDPTAVGRRAEGVFTQPTPKGGLADREATRPRPTASRLISGILSRDRGRPCSCGNSQASALTASTTLGGKAGRAPATRPLFEAGKTLFEKPFPPFADDLTRRVEASGDLVVAEAGFGVENDLGPDDIPIW